MSFTKKRAAFSLLELLVGVVVVFILGALVVAAVSPLKERSLNTRCVSHLRQLGHALFQFAADHNGKIPGRSYRPPSAEADEVWHRLLVRTGYVQGSIRPAVGGGTPSSPILYCPAFYPAGPLDSIHAYMRYGMRVWSPPGQNFDSSRLLPLNIIKEPANFFLVADSYGTEREGQGYQISPGNAMWRVHLRHGPGLANALFADGHVEAKGAAYFETIHLTQDEYAGGASKRFFIQPSQ